MSNWIVCIVSGLFGLLGLFLAANAVDDGIYVFGLALFGFGLLMNFWIIKLAYDATDRAQRRLASG